MSSTIPKRRNPPIWRRFSEPRTRASLFHYIEDKPDPGIWTELNSDVIKHPLRFLMDEWRSPRTQASLFHYVEDQREEPFRWAEFLKDVLFGTPPPSFIPAVLSDPREVAVDPAELRAGRRRALLISLLAHLALVVFAVLLVFRHVTPLPQKENIVFVSPPFISPFEGTGPDGGGGGGGGKGQKTPPATGRMPDTSRVQMTPPDPEDPKPLVPAEDLTSPSATVVMPIDIPQDQALPIGDIQAPPNDSKSSGPGSGGGIGTGQGTGVGSGSGPGVGPGSGGGMGGGSGGGIGSGQGPYVVGGGVRPPVAINQPLPMYTEEARKAKVEGLVLIQAIVRKDGSVDSFKVIRGLGYGLDESAINTIATKWRFRPGTYNGQAVDVQCSIEVSFRLY
jgi:periplasmic protein TonB